MWAPLPPDRSAVPVLLYHGIGPESDFSDAADASYGIDFDDFAKQMTMIAHAGYQTIDLQTFRRFVQGEAVDLPPRPLLLTFDDARADSWTGGDGILQTLGFNAVMFVDVGRVDDGNPEYLTWQELETVQASGRWQLQLHSGDGHRQIQYGPGPNDYGPYYAYEQQDEDFDGWQKRVRSDIDWGQDTLARPHPCLPPARLRSSVRQLRPGRHQRPTHPRGSPRLADRSATAPSSPRTGTRGRTEAADSRSAGSRSRENSPAATSTPSCCREAPSRDSTRAGARVAAGSRAASIRFAAPSQALAIANEPQLGERRTRAVVACRTRPEGVLGDDRRSAGPFRCRS